MAHIDNLIERIGDTELRAQIAEQVAHLTSRKDFGLVFQEHLPEAIEIPGLRPRRGDIVKLRGTGKRPRKLVLSTRSGIATVGTLNVSGEIEGESEEFPFADINVVKHFGEPIYAGLHSINRITRAPEKSTHVVIKGENYYALETLLYTHEGRIDAIYIDPPYNTGNEGWQYNDRYVDDDDAYRHSKWLAFMERRLRHAKRLLKANGALAISISEQEVHRLALLVGQVFPSAAINLVTVQTSGGKSSGGMNRIAEYVLFAFLPGFEPGAVTFAGTKSRSPWEGLTLSTFDQVTRPNQAYPIYVDRASGVMTGVGKTLRELKRSGDFTGELADWEFKDSNVPPGSVAVWPISSKGDHCVWRLIPSSFLAHWDEGFIRIVPNGKDHPNDFSVQFVPSGTVKRFRSGKLIATGKVEGVPTLLFGDNDTEGATIPTIWSDPAHYNAKGTAQLGSILGKKDFPYPKSPTLMHSIVEALAGRNPEAVILDYFAGTGTTLEAVLQVNADDDGLRQAILVTNNELSHSTSDALEKAGHVPGDEAWESEGIFEKVTRPRIETVLTGIRPDGSKYSDGYDQNVEFFRLTYEDENLVALGRKFDAITPLLWMKAGASGPQIYAVDMTDGWALPHDGQYAVLFDVQKTSDFVAAVWAADEMVRHAFITTDSESTFQAVVAQLPKESVVFSTTRLYSDYLRSFKINGVD